MKPIRNSKAIFDYVIRDRMETGIQLTGAEVKSLRTNRAKLDGAFVKIIGSELYLVGAHIFPYPFARPENYDPKRTRKLLVHKKELLKLTHKVDSDGLTLVPLSWYTKGHNIKLEIALAKGKKQYEKRDSIKRRDEKRDLERHFRGKVTPRIKT